YYAVLTGVINNVYSPKERQREEHLLSAQLAIHAITSPVEVGPVAKMIGALRLARAEAELLVTKFAAVLEKISDDDRAFTSSLYETDAAMQALLKNSAEASEALAGAYRRYLVANLSGRRCSESADPKWFTAKLEAELADRFKLSAEERRPAKVEGSADLGPIYDDPETKRMQAKSQRLMFGGREQGLSDAQKNTPEWRAELLDYVNAIENWKPALAKSELEVFVLKEGFLSSIIWIAPPGPDRDRLIGRFVASLKISG